MMVTKTRLLRLALAPLFLAVSAAGCTNPVDDEHDGPVGFVILNAQGQQVASYSVAAGATGQIAVARNSATTFQVQAVAEDGDRIAVDGTEVGLKASVVGTGVAATLQGSDRVVITGTQSGQATLRLTITHEGHDELTGNVTVAVGS